jgi:nucleoside-diphosphate-sugar epimerase
MSGSVAGRDLAVDHQHMLMHTRELWEDFRGQRIFITGGTGFFGAWLLESFSSANETLRLKAKAVVLTRNVLSFRKRAPHLVAKEEIEFVQGDVKNFAFPPGEFAYVIHAATENAALAKPLAPERHFARNLAGTQRILRFSQECGAQKFLFTSSGAIYGTQPTEISHLPEAYSGAPSLLDSGSAYAQSKRASEFLCAAHHKTHGIDTTIARCFAFSGPHLALDQNYAIGNFVGNALRGEPVTINGDGTPVRSYLYGADLGIWIWTILARGQGGQAYNVGSDVAVSIEALARLVAEVVNPLADVVVKKKDPTKLPDRYVPAIDRARMELGLEPRINLREGIRRMAEWYRLNRL